MDGLKKYPPYCDCYFPKAFVASARMQNLFKLTKCRCGETDCEANTFTWQWEASDSLDVKIKDQDVALNPFFSTGTAFVKGNKSLETGMIHFWEMRVVSPLFGTDVMFGVGTSKVNFDSYKSVFTSALGLNSSSWGFSYTGHFQHDSKTRRYGHAFQQGCIVGVYVDRVLGYIEFFLNRTSLGIASYNIPIDPSVQLYPMVCSTSAYSVIRLMNATSVVDSLQYRAFQLVTKRSEDLSHIKSMPGMKNLVSKYWFLAPSVRPTQHISNFDDIMDEAVLGNKKALRKISNQPEIKDEDSKDIYSNIEDVLMDTTFSDSESAEEDYDPTMDLLFDEYFYNLPFPGI